MNNLFKIICLVALAAVSVAATDYCNKKLCSGTGTTHIACDNKGKFASSCPDDAKMCEITESLRKLILKDHNEKRNSFAGGDESFKPACRMATLEWDDELAKLAALNVKQCQMKHDHCHNTDNFKYSGQNLAMVGYNGKLNDTERILQSIKIWFDEKKDVKQSILDKYPNGYKGPEIGHFTAMMVDRSARVGCAASTYSVSGQSYKYYLLACNYASTNMVGFPIYKSCDKAATDCKSGTNSLYKNLCSTSESYAVNKFP